MPEATLALIFVTAYAVGLTGAMSPGPLLATTIAQSSRRGFWAGPGLAAGHSLLELVTVGLLTTGLVRLLAHSTVSGAIGLLGGVFLIFIGVDIMRGAWRGDQWGSATASPSQHSPVLLGVLISLANPFWEIWWVTIGASYIVWALQLGVAGLATFYAGHILSDFSWYSLVALVTSAGRRVTPTRVYRIVLGVCGGFNLALGLFFLWTGLTTFLPLWGTPRL